MKTKITSFFKNAFWGNLMKNIINKTVATIEIKEVEKYILNIDEKANKSFIPVNIYQGNTFYQVGVRVFPKVSLKRPILSHHHLSTALGTENFIEVLSQVFIALDRILVVGKPKRAHLRYEQCLVQECFGAQPLSQP